MQFLLFVLTQSGIKLVITEKSFPIEDQSHKQGSQDPKVQRGWTMVTDLMTLEVGRGTITNQTDMNGYKW
ncbi:hypothetical protein V3C99_000748 [Haemonchus contortus]